VKASAQDKVYASKGYAFAIRLPNGQSLYAASLPSAIKKAEPANGTVDAVQDGL
jgi:hypothetical protein